MRRAPAIAVLIALAGCHGKTEVDVLTGDPAPGEELPADGVVVTPGQDEPLVDQLPPFEPPPPRLRRLLAWQYQNAVSDLLGAAAAAKVSPPPDTTVNGLSAIGAAQLSLSVSALTAYETSAHLAAQVALADPARRGQLVPCVPANDADEACFQQLVVGFGKRAFRRPLTPVEVATWTQLGREAGSASESFWKGAEYVVAGLLQSPHFLYQVEVGAPDPVFPGRQKLSGLEIATKLSFFLVGSTPSDALLAAAEAGELDTAEGVRAHAQALVQDPRARPTLTRLLDELLELSTLPGVAKNTTAYPTWSPALASSMLEETRRFFEDAVWEADVDFRALLDAEHTFVDGSLAAHYGVTIPAGTTGWTRVALPASQGRAGLFGQASFLSLMAHPTSTSPTHRGKFIREKLLCEPVEAAPSNVDTTLPPLDPNAPPKTLREKLEYHLTNVQCAGCHKKMDPIGLGFEHFDAVGRWRATEVGKPIDASGSLDQLGAFTDAKGLAALLKKDPRAPGCFARTVFRSAAGHVDTLGETRPMKVLDDAFAASGFKVKRLLVEVAASDAFRYGGAP